MPCGGTAGGLPSLEPTIVPELSNALASAVRYAGEDPGFERRATYHTCGWPKNFPMWLQISLTPSSSLPEVGVADEQLATQSACLTEGS